MDYKLLKYLQGFKAGKMQVITVDCKGKSMCTDYEQIARGAGFVVVESCIYDNLWYWYLENWGADTQEPVQEGYSNTQKEAWKACCEENNLLRKS